jgi:ACS family hexuronate transporter-like MFS transporter
MPSPVPDVRIPGRTASWKWWVCSLLLLATMINYMDRLTLNLLGPTIQTNLNLRETIDYGNFEFGFGIAFALGSITCGFLADRWNVFWLYPLAVVAWSAAGICSGLATGFWTMLTCRVLLGLAEGANWPCALRTTQHILPPSERSMGNSILQSGAAAGAIVIPLVLMLLFDEAHPETWRRAFFVVGGVGMLWVVLWWAVLRPADLSLEHTPVQSQKASSPPLSRTLAVRRVVALLALVVTINMTWHFLRAWLPMYLEKSCGYRPKEVFWFSTFYYLCAGLGCLAAGSLTVWVTGLGWTVHQSRRLAFLAFALLCALTMTVPFLTPGPLLIGVLLVVAFGALGMFPNYYSFSQDLTVKHQGKVTGTMGFFCWVTMSLWHRGIAEVVQATGSYTSCFLIAGLLPLLGYLALLVLWGPTEVVSAPVAPPRTVAVENEETQAVMVAPDGVRAG